MDVDVADTNSMEQGGVAVAARHLVVSLANLKFKLHFNPILSEQQKEQVIEITLLALCTLQPQLPIPYCNTTHVYG